MICYLCANPLKNLQKHYNDFFGTCNFCKSYNEFKNNQLYIFNGEGAFYRLRITSELYWMGVQTEIYDLTANSTIMTLNYMVKIEDYSIDKTAKKYLKLQAFI